MHSLNVETLFNLSEWTYYEVEKTHNPKYDVDNHDVLNLEENE